MGSRFRGNDGWGAAHTVGRRGRRGAGGEGDGFPPRIGVRGRLFAGTTVGEPPIRWDGGEGEGQGERGMGSRPVSGYGAGFPRERRLGSRPYGETEGKERGRGRGGWVPAPYRGTGQAFRGNDGWGAAPGFPGSRE